MSIHNAFLCISVFLFYRKIARCAATICEMCQGNECQIFFPHRAAPLGTPLTAMCGYCAGPYGTDCPAHQRQWVQRTAARPPKDNGGAVVGTANV